MIRKIIVLLFMVILVGTKVEAAGSVMIQSFYQEEECVTLRLVEEGKEDFEAEIPMYKASTLTTNNTAGIAYITYTGDDEWINENGFMYTMTNPIIIAYDEMEQELLLNDYYGNIVEVKGIDEDSETSEGVIRIERIGQSDVGNDDVEVPEEEHEIGDKDLGASIEELKMHADWKGKFGFVCFMFLIMAGFGLYLYKNDMFN